MAATSSKPRILLLIPNLGLGGAQRVFRDQAQALAEPFEVTECVFNLDQAHDYHTTNQLVSLDVAGGGSSVQKLRNFAARCSKLRDIKRRQRIAVSISHLEGADYANVLSGAGEKRILCIHGSKMHDQNIRGIVGWIRRYVLIPLLYRRANHIVTVSRGIREELVQQLGLPRAKVSVINNFFDVEGVQERAQEPLQEPYARMLDAFPVLVTAGRFAPEKNLLPLLEIFAQLRQKVARCKLLLVGHGEMYDALLARSTELGLRTHVPEQAPEEAFEADVLFAGFQTNPYKFVARSSVFVLPSRNEGFPMAMGEAMICGTVVAAADCPTGPREILAPDSDVPVGSIRMAEWTNTGVLLPLLNQPESVSDDQKVWVETLAELLNNSDKRTQLAVAAQHRMQDFTRDRIFDQWKSLLRTLLT
ncbi:glycosyltransferase [Hymenobacter oligotrophus]|uniref:Glycosyltransferase n=1 Tax=Hymenobacter oligotrophus TaxID=2319843 RepID=A0A3B7QVQ9_9BACT|nr:glycosyltransferase [Hymenobacter oligotrophus]AYA37188.1 glycosyltransferase [Hymenobacter oligotrophus]